MGNNNGKTNPACSPFCHMNRVYELCFFPSGVSALVGHIVNINTIGFHLWRQMSASIYLRAKWDPLRDVGFTQRVTARSHCPCFSVLMEVRAGWQTHRKRPRSAWEGPAPKQDIFYTWKREAERLELKFLGTWGHVSVAVFSVNKAKHVNTP